jgi:SRSO17 transposase
MISEIKRKTLPAIARAVGLQNAQPLHHFLSDSPWSVSSVRQRRLQILLKALKGKPFILCIDETGDKKKGKTTDYVERQYIGNLGKIENGIVSVNAYGILEGITFPLIFKIFKPSKRLKPDDKYKTKPELAKEIIEELRELGFQFEIVLADSLYGESSNFIDVLYKYNIQFVVAVTLLPQPLRKLSQITIFQETLRNSRVNYAVFSWSLFDFFPFLTTGCLDRLGSPMVKS